MSSWLPDCNRFPGALLSDNGGFAVKSSKVMWVALAGAWAATVPAMPSAGETVVISRDDCLRAIRHVPSADAAYAPGVDARGRPVAPADLGGGPRIALPEILAFDINIDVGRYLGGSRYGTLDMAVGTVVYDVASGRLTFNGEVLTDADQRAVAEACRRAYGEKR